MEIAIVHFHLNRGGVTQVIVNQLRSLAAVASREPVRVLVLYGGRRQDWPEGVVDHLPGVSVELRAVAALEYDAGAVRVRSEELGEQLQAVLEQHGFRSPTAVVHVHNHALGKNVSLPGALWRLARDGYPLLLQTHDFAEDFRPDNYRRLAEGLAADDPEALAAALYPQAPQIHYAVLNGRDRRLLGQMGVAEDRLHLLANPVAALESLPSRAAARGRLAERQGVDPGEIYVLYPVRGIRRKNLGEALLWSAVLPPKCRFGLTLPPLNELERPRYAFWKACAAELSLPFLFEVGGPAGLPFGDHVAAADLVLTTSVAEGFGMTFLEPCLAGLPLVGRDLPEITADFRAAGMEFPGLAERLNVPLTNQAWEPIEQETIAAYCQVLKAFGRTPPPADVLRRQARSLLVDGQVDFAVLRAERQREVIRRACGDAAFQAALRAANPVLDGWETVLGERRGGAAAPPITVGRNAAAVRRHFSLLASGQRLWTLYRRLQAASRTDLLQPPPRGAALLDAFLDLHRLHPLRIEP